MALNRHIEIILVVLLYLSVLYFWTLPIQENPVPYGEVDAASHYAVADYTYTSDKSIGKLPYYIDQRYGKDNQFKKHTLWYPPPFHTNLAIAAFLGGATTVPLFIANAIFCSLIVLSVYFLVRKFYGWKSAFASALLVGFSLRDVLIYLWGQWPERMGFAYLPLVIYCLYKYSQSYVKKKERPVYLYIMAILLAINLFIHPMDFFHSLGALGIIGLFFVIKERKLFFSLKHAAFAVLLFFAIISIFPTQTLNVLAIAKSGESVGDSSGDFSRLFSWFKTPENNPGVPPDYFSYTKMVGPWWTVPFLLLGLVFLLLRRKNKDLVFLGWLTSLYIMIHLDVIGMGRVHRSLSGTAHIFYPLMFIGLIYTVSFIGKEYSRILKPLVMVLFTVFVLFTTGAAAYSALSTYYDGLGRMNPYQGELVNWLRQSEAGKDSYIFHAGSISLAKTRWLWMASQRFINDRNFENIKGNLTHLIADYSDFALMGNQDAVNSLNTWEKSNVANESIIYSNDYIRVYKLEN